MEKTIQLARELSDFSRARITTLDEYAGTPTNKHRVLLVGLFSTELLRPGVDVFNWDKFGEKYDTIFTAFRLFDIDDKLILDVPVSQMRTFLDKATCVNAIFRLHRPVIITMLDGGRFEDLPVLSTSSGNACKNDSFILSYNCGKYPLLVNPDGRYAYTKPKRVLQYKLEHQINFYNL